MGTTFFVILLSFVLATCLIFCYLQHKLVMFTKIDFGELLAYCSNDPQVYEDYKTILSTKILFSYKTYKKFKETIRSIGETCIDSDIIRYIFDYRPTRVDDIVDWCVSSGKYGTAVLVSSFMQMKYSRICQSTVYACDVFVTQNHILNYGNCGGSISAAIYNTFVSAYNMAHSTTEDSLQEKYQMYMKDAKETGVLGYIKEESEHDPEEYNLDKFHPVYEIHYEKVGADYAQTLVGSIPIHKVLHKMCDAGYYAAAEMYCCQLYDVDFKQENEKCGCDESLIDNKEFVDALARVLNHKYCDDIKVGHSKFYPDLCDIVCDNMMDDTTFLKLVDLKAEYILSTKK